MRGLSSALRARPRYALSPPIHCALCGAPYPLRQAPRESLPVPKGIESLKAVAAFLIKSLRSRKLDREGALSGRTVRYFRGTHTYVPIYVLYCN
jgi:hypothetical protein